MEQKRKMNKTRIDQSVCVRERERERDMIIMQQWRNINNARIDQSPSKSVCERELWSYDYYGAKVTNE